MKPFAVTLISGLLVLSGCDQPPHQTASEQTKTSSAPQKSIAEQAIDVSLSSPETARRLAVSSPEAVAVAAARAAEVVARGAAAAPESSLVKVTAYAKLANFAADVVPGSTAARDAALRASSQRKIVEDLIKTSPSK